MKRVPMFGFLLACLQASCMASLSHDASRGALDEDGRRSLAWACSAADREVAEGRLIEAYAILRRARKALQEHTEPYVDVTSVMADTAIGCGMWELGLVHLSEIATSVNRAESSIAPPASKIDAMRAVLLAEMRLYPASLSALQEASKSGLDAEMVDFDRGLRSQIQKAQEQLDSKRRLVVHEWEEEVWQMVVAALQAGDEDAVSDYAKVWELLCGDGDGKHMATALRMIFDGKYPEAETLLRPVRESSAGYYWAWACALSGSWADLNEWFSHQVPESPDMKRFAAMAALACGNMDAFWGHVRDLTDDH